MGKFRFSNYTPANVAKPAKAPTNKGYPSANTLLKSAKVEGKIQDKPSTLANISNTLASQKPHRINNLSNISNISRGQGVNSKKTYQWSTNTDFRFSEINTRNEMALMYSALRRLHLRGVLPLIYDRLEI